MTHLHSGLDPAQVLKALRDEAASQLSAQQETRLLSRIEASAGLVGAGASLGHASGTAGTQGVRAADHIALTDQIAAHLAVRPLATLVSTLVLGGALGVVGHATVTSRHQQQIDVHAQKPAALQAAPATVPSDGPGPGAGIDALPEIEPEPQAGAERFSNSRRAGTAMPKRTLAVEAPVASSGGPNLAEQLALLETARGAIQKRDASAALRALSSHAAQFPSSVLNEERDALTIKALVMANRRAEAAGRLVQFETAYPGSLLLPALRQSVGNFP
jgi:hypothetical protein